MPTATVDRSVLTFARSVPAGTLRAAVPHLLLIGILIASGIALRRWAYATTFNLFLDQRVDDSPGSAATQRFDLEPGGVVPRMLTRDDRVTFRTHIHQDSTIEADVLATQGAAFEVRLCREGVERILAAGGSSSTPVSLQAPVPPGDNDLQLISHGEVTWSNLRVERAMNLAPVLVLIVLLLVSMLAWRRYAVPPFSKTPPVASRGLQAWMFTFMIAATVLVSLILVEVTLRAVGGRLSSGISALRHDLGEPTEDPRWQETPRYGRRLRPNANVPGEWKYGDIIRMGFVPQAEGDGRVHRYPYQSDSEGFRNSAPRDSIEVAALGDSFTDALTMRREDAWPAQLEARLGRPVQNYGTAGFGPQQELLVLKDFALPHHPRVVVLAFFAGNDIRDAEAFESFARAEALPNEPKPGWPIKAIVMRADTWFLTSAIQAASRALSDRASEAPAASHPATPNVPVPAGPSFSRGMFTAEVGGRRMRVALMPPYLNVLNFAEPDLAARRGWTLIESTLMEMQAASRAAGAEFVVAFIPFKSQVYLPLLDRLFPRAELTQALHFYSRDRTKAPDVDRMLRNRLAQNALMARFCERAGIPLLDLTQALQARIEAGEAMYFPDDSHLDEDGEALVADQVASFLEARRLLR